MQPSAARGRTAECVAKGTSTAARDGFRWAKAVVSPSTRLADCPRLEPIVSKRSEIFPRPPPALAGSRQNQLAGQATCCLQCGLSGSSTESARGHIPVLKRQTVGFRTTLLAKVTNKTPRCGAYVVVRLLNADIRAWIEHSNENPPSSGPNHPTRSATSSSATAHGSTNHDSRGPTAVGTTDGAAASPLYRLRPYGGPQALMRRKGGATTLTARECAKRCRRSSMLLDG